MKIPEFKSLGDFFIKGRGRVIVVLNDKDRDFNEPFYNRVVIDNILYEVKGVEYFAISKIREGAKIGLLIKRADGNV